LLTDTERKKIVSEFFQKAIAKNLIINTTPTNFSIKTQKISRNANAAADTYFRFKQVYDDPLQLKQFTDFNNKTLSIPIKDSELLLLNFFVFHALNYLESYKLILLEILKQGSKIGKRQKTISLSLELGSLAVSLSQELTLPDFQKLFPILFRNVLGHSSWWWDQNRLAYEENGFTKYLTIKEFSEQMEDFGKNMQAIIDEYLRSKATKKI